MALLPSVARPSLSAIPPRTKASAPSSTSLTKGVPLWSNAFIHGVARRNFPGESTTRSAPLKSREPTREKWGHQFQRMPNAHRIDGPLHDDAEGIWTARQTASPCTPNCDFLFRPIKHEHRFHRTNDQPFGKIVTAEKQNHIVGLRTVLNSRSHPDFQRCNEPDFLLSEEHHKTRAYQHHRLVALRRIHLCDHNFVSA